MSAMDAALEAKSSQWTLANDPWDTDSYISSEDRDDSDWDEDWSGCPCCVGLSRSYITAFQQAEDLFAADFRNESHMNTAGRTTTHPYRDIRSASFAIKRSRRYPDSKPRTRGIGSRKWEKADRRRESKRRKRDTLSYEIQTNQRRERVWSPGKPKNIEMVVWDTNLQEEFDEYIEDMSDDVIRYEKLHKNFEVFESSAPYTKTGETFSAWAQRRITEMRAVKESRIQTVIAPLEPPVVFATNRLLPMRMGTKKSDYSVYCGSPLTTTLPTNSYDAHGHALLRAALTPSKWARQQARFNPKVSLFPTIVGFNWFCEYTWRWHRNASGCWQIGYECGGCAIPCPCCNSGNGSMYYQCYCEEFADDLAPDERQQCSLVEWIGPEGKRLIINEELANDTCCENVDALDSDGEWSFVDVSFGVQSCSSVASSERIE